MTTRLGDPFRHIPGDSWLHRRSPIAKLAWVLAVIVFAFASYHPFPLFALTVLGVGAGASAGVGRPLVRILLVFAPITASMIVIQTMSMAACAPSCVAVANVGPVALYQEGLARGLTLASRVLAMESVALAVLLTTHPADLFASLATLRVPHSLNLMIATTLRSVPLLQREIGIVLDAQRARGRRARGFGAIVPTVVPAFVGTFERARQLSISLESRGFGSAQRTSMRHIRFGRIDGLWLIAAFVTATTGVVLGRTAWSIDRLPAIGLTADQTVAVFAMALVTFVGVIGVGILALVRISR